MAGLDVDVDLVLDDASGDGLRALEERVAADGLGGAWVTPAAAARGGDPGRFDEIVPSNGRVQVVPVLLPPAAEPGALERGERIAAGAPCRIARVCPTAHGYPLVDWVLSPLPEICARGRMALVLDFATDRVPWRDVADLARAFPALPLVVLGGRLGDERAIPAVLDATANVVVELSRVRDAGALAHLAGVFGAHRFVWGSGGSDQAGRLRSALAAALEPDAGAGVLGDNARALADGTYVEAYL
jgi:hypothetical protein